MFGKQKVDKKKLERWKERLSRDSAAYSKQREKMDARELLYMGSHDIAAVGGGHAKPATHVRNIVAELIESQVDSNIPQPKVTARRPEDEKLAKMIEDMLRNELDRLDFERMNDLQERTAPIQGGSFFLAEWDNTERSHTTVGEIAVSLIHPKQVIPQDGVFAGVQEMDHLILAIPQTKASIRKKYEVDVSGEAEQDPDVKGAGETGTAEEMVTQYIGFERGENGRIGMYSWAGDTQICDISDYQARRLGVCKKCGQPGQKPCRYCGSESFETRAQEFETVLEDIVRSDGEVIPALSVTPDGYGNLAEGYTKLPAYVPDVFPVVLRKNVSVYGQLLGDSDVDKISDQQNSIKKLSTKALEKLLKGGSFVTLPAGLKFETTDEELRVVRIENPAELAMIKTESLQPDVSGDLAMQEKLYEEARQIVGVTDSFQGRKDPTATSGKAKEFAAAQTAGRLESKRIMKNAAYAELFEIMFKLKLAYADEPRAVVSRDERGATLYSTFNRYDFLKQDAAGAWYWEDDFLFSTDASATLAGNREAMWQETSLNLQKGAFGDPRDIKTLIMYWTIMEQLHYPLAATVKANLQNELEERQKMEAMQMQLQARMQGQAAGFPGGLGSPPGGMPAGAPVQTIGGMPDAMSQMPS